MKNLLLTLLALGATLAAGAETPNRRPPNPKATASTDIEVIETTPVKDQSRSGTCWCYSTLSFLESEILKAGGAPIHLSEMWIVRHSFMDKAEKYIRMHGKIQLRRGRRLATT